MNDQKMVLYSYWRSSASYRVRIALALKGIDADIHPVHLVRNGGQQLQPDYLALNPQGLVPCLVHGKIVLTQSLAIIEYLDECFRDPPLLPGTPAERARVRMLAQTIACDIHPLNNLRVLKFLEHQAGLAPEPRTDWYRYWTETGLQAVERQLKAVPGEPDFCFGPEPGLADCLLLPQVYNARRFDCSLDGCDRIISICDRLAADDRIRGARPENQPDAE
ncbi:MAG: maleylacetoacetate isomerase [Wenzhouxiangella sp.]|jgi:maleylacetoacetate isomerase|nr:maleylacetoacetate isomerase [Wenzhouxiangella sp.]